MIVRRGFSSASSTSIEQIRLSMFSRCRRSLIRRGGASSFAKASADKCASREHACTDQAIEADDRFQPFRQRPFPGVASNAPPIQGAAAAFNLQAESLMQ
jgi:hypothetical protein